MLSTMLLPFFGLFLVILSSSCAQITIYRKAPQAQHPETTQIHSENADLMVFNTIRMTDPIDLNQRCPEGWTQIQTRMNGGDALFSFMIFEFFQSYEVDLHCRTSPAFKQNPVESRGNSGKVAL